MRDHSFSWFQIQSSICTATCTSKYLLSQPSKVPRDMCNSIISFLKGWWCGFYPKKGEKR
uniref:Uncharacterized protein n=1 Tax=Arundo donax TaxID=35708 RepID=A0A0A9CPU9_ARUDO